MLGEIITADSQWVQVVDTADLCDSVLPLAKTNEMIVGGSVVSWQVAGTLIRGMICINRPRGKDRRQIVFAICLTEADVYYAQCWIHEHEQKLKMPIVFPSLLVSNLKQPPGWAISFLSRLMACFAHRTFAGNPLSTDNDC